MKKITTNFLLFFTLFLSALASAQCLEADNGQWPFGTISATACDGITSTVATEVGYASEYSLVELVAGETYTFKSSVATDYITIGSEDGTSAIAFGVTPLTWVSDVSGVVSFYTHIDDLCGGDGTTERIRSFVCGIPPCIVPTVTFSKTYDCGSSTFQVEVDITDVGDAASITVADDQGSATQSVSSANLVIFGPYAFGTSVVLTATNDQTPVCNVVSDTQIVYACPPLNDECADAIVLNCGDVITNQITDGATGGTSTSCAGTIGDDIWYTFVGNGQVITLTATATVEFPQLEVYASADGTCTGITAGDCIAVDGYGDSIASVALVSEIGTTYYMHVGSWINGDPAIVFDLSMTCMDPATPPANDECDGAYAVTVNSDMSCASVTAGDLSGATASTLDDTDCFGTADDDVWFSFVATETRHSVSLNDIAGSTTDLYHSLWSGDCSGLSFVPDSCSDDEASTQSGLTVGETYYIRVYSYTDLPLQTSTFNLCVGTLPPPPANDECIGAVELTVGTAFETSPITGSNLSSSSTSGLTFTCQTNRANDVWYSAVVPASGNLTVETAPAPESNMTDSVISVFIGDCTSLVEVGCNDDDGIDNFSKAVVTGLTPGETVYIGVWKYGSSSDGDFLLSAYDESLSNDSFDASSFKAYPNPVKNILNLSYNKIISNVAVFNLLGQEVTTKSASDNQSQIDMSNLASGTYLVKVTADNQIKTIKIIKE